MNYSNIKFSDIANGVGVRTTLFVSSCQGCTCEGCFNYEAWDFKSGGEFTQKLSKEVIDSLAPVYINGLSILGGEPFEPENQEGLVEFVEKVRATYPQKSIWMYSGHTWDQLTEGKWHTEYTDRILSCIDVLVDGPWVQSLHDITLRFGALPTSVLLMSLKRLLPGELHLVRWTYAGFS